MISFLANLFRGLHGVIGITAPPEGQNERPFVMLWLGLILMLIVFCAALAYLSVRAF